MALFNAPLRIDPALRDIVAQTGKGRVMSVMSQHTRILLIVYVVDARGGKYHSLTYYCWLEMCRRKTVKGGNPFKNAMKMRSNSYGSLVNECTVEFPFSKYYCCEKGTINRGSKDLVSYELPT